MIIKLWGVSLLKICCSFASKLSHFEVFEETALGRWGFDCEVWGDQSSIRGHLLALWWALCFKSHLHHRHLHWHQHYVSHMERLSSWLLQFVKMSNWQLLQAIATCCCPTCHNYWPGVSRGGNICFLLIVFRFSLRPGLVMRRWRGWVQTAEAHWWWVSGNWRADDPHHCSGRASVGLV